MNLAKISCNGQVTVPVEIRRALDVKSGDKIVFLRKQDGEIVMKNLNAAALAEAHRILSTDVKESLA
ncbi:MAG: AbrB/MazE/SpoVT family DNA-binding domain-containing protein [Defluviitaleaceae bacterium]|nr:AbrB/MazE/SpoVT family DNA-binding domain-containing protein [Defluviitaleaceae bacterium]